MSEQDAGFDRNVFINCPFDGKYESILQAILFCLIFLNFHPRIATERMDASENRLEKIKELIDSSKFSIHDLSRCQAESKGEHYRLNMPFELGVDYGCKNYCDDARSDKRILILEEKPYRYQVTLSDLAGCDIQAHQANPETVVRKVRNWLVSEAGVEAPGAATIYAKYSLEFQEWYYKRQLAAGFSEEDIQDYPTNELLEAMKEWVQLFH